MGGITQQRRGQGGTGMAGAMIALLLLGLMAQGVMEQRLRLVRLQQRQAQYLQALNYSHLLLERYRLTAPATLPVLAKGWQMSVQSLEAGENCRRIVARVTTPAGDSVSLSEWFCGPGLTAQHAPGAENAGGAACFQDK